LGELSFDSGTDTVSGTITNNGGTGDITVLRQLGTGDYIGVATGSPSAMAAAGVSDVPDVDGTYNYKLIQAGIAGNSEVRSVAVDVDEPGGGTPPTISTDTVLTNYIKINFTVGAGQTGDVTFYKKRGGGSYMFVDSVVYNSGNIEDSFFSQKGTYTYKAIQVGVSGESNTIIEFIDI